MNPSGFSGYSKIREKKGCDDRMKQRVICINREHGTNGKALGEMVADQLGITCYTRTLINKAIVFGNLQTEEAMQEFLEKEEAERKAILHDVDTESYEKAKKLLPSTDTVFRLEEALLTGLAEKEDYVVIGRCAGRMLADKNVELLRVFVTASEDYCIERIMTATGRSHGEARIRVANINRLRRDSYYSYSGRYWQDTTEYDLKLNVENMGIHRLADLLCAYYNDVMPTYISLEETAEDISKK